MPTHTFILCPGQGAQAVGMGKELFEKSAAARAVFEDANKILGFELTSLCFAGPEQTLNQTDISQPGLFATGVASFRGAVEAGTIEPAAITAYAGLSLGEYTALHLAGVFSFEDGLRLVAARGKYMQEAAVATPSGMVALKADENAVNELCAQSAQGEILSPANINAPGQIVVSGTLAACQRLVAAAAAGGVLATALKVAGAFHSALMQGAAGRMGQELDRVAFSAPALPVYSNVTAQPHEDVPSIKRRLVEQIVSPVQWERTMRALISIDEQGRYIELAPGRVLTGIARKINRRLPVENV